MQPRRYGGLETDFRTKLEVTRELALGCGSTVWATSLINVCAWFAGMWNEQAQDDVWKDNPSARIAGVLAPSGTVEPVNGGYRLTGRWAWCTGCLHAQWALLGVPITDDNGQLTDQGFVLVPMSELSIEDTWFVTGMRGTGSNTVAANNVFVPAHRYLSAFQLLSGSNDNPHKDEALYRAPWTRLIEWIRAGATQAGAGPDFGDRLPAVFSRAGLSHPQAAAVSIAGDADSLPGAGP
jgi:3-hydroxy-9,10-secoandrosta-1,3,5(10)-triene-9,17-dione monooxygenase